MPMQQDHKWIFTATERCPSIPSGAFFRHIIPDQIQIGCISFSFIKFIFPSPQVTPDLRHRVSKILSHTSMNLKWNTLEMSLLNSFDDLSIKIMKIIDNCRYCSSNGMICTRPTKKDYIRLNSVNRRYQNLYFPNCMVSSGVTFQKD